MDSSKPDSGALLRAVLLGPQPPRSIDLLYVRNTLRVTVEVTQQFQRVQIRK